MKTIEGIYRHYKGNLYCVICTAEHTETREDLVVYRSATGGENVSAAELAVGSAAGEQRIWARPRSMWHEEVMVDGVLQPRFQFLAESVEALDEEPMFRVIEAIKDNMEQYQHFGENNTLRFYHKQTGDILVIDEFLLGLIEDGESTDGCAPAHVAGAEKILANRDDYLRLPVEGTSPYGRMVEFIYELPVAYQDDLRRAIEGKGAFRRFRDAAARLGVLKDWYRHRDAAYRKEARLWCDRNGIEWWRDML